VNLNRIEKSTKTEPVEREPSCSNYCGLFGGRSVTVVNDGDSDSTESYISGGNCKEVYQRSGLGQSGEPLRIKVPNLVGLVVEDSDEAFDYQIRRGGLFDVRSNPVEGSSYVSSGRGTAGSDEDFDPDFERALQESLEDAKGASPKEQLPSGDNKEVVTIQIERSPFSCGANVESNVQDYDEKSD
jgi:hypothetical protein